MSSSLLHVAEDFWNLRGSFKIGGIIDIGTQASLVRKKDGRFVFLDACSLTGSVAREVEQLTEGGKAVDAILNLHPFHTVHVNEAHERYPHAKLYGTARHLSRFPTLPWEATCTEDPGLHEMFAEDFDFSIPRGVDFISANERVHFSSVLTRHRASRTIHVDDTLMHVRLPAILRWFGLEDRVSFHPTLSRALEQRSGAAADFRLWAEDLIVRWGDSENLCAAHTSALLGRNNQGAPLHERLCEALCKAGSTLKAHERKHG